MSHIFISYSRKNLEFAQKIVDALAENNLDTWIDWKSIPKGEDWWEHIQDGIEEANAFLFLISPDSAESDVCRDEIEYAQSNGKRILPILIRDTEAEDVHEEIAKRNWIFCREGQDDFQAAIAETSDTVNTDYEWLKYHTRLQVKALEWERFKDSSRLLRGAELQGTEKFFAEIDNQADPQPTKLQRTYIVASRRNESRQRRRLIASLGIGCSVITLLFFAAGVAAVIAMTQANRAATEAQAKSTALVEEEIAQATAQAENVRANEQTLLALSRQLANSSIKVPHADLDLKLLLSAQAYNFADTAEARSSLFGNLVVEPYLEGILGWEGGLDFQSNFDTVQYLESHPRFGSRGWFSVEKTYVEEKFPDLSTSPPNSSWGYYSSPLVSSDGKSVAYMVCKVLAGGGADTCETMIVVWKSEQSLISYGESVDEICNSEYQSRTANLKIDPQGEGKFALLDNHGKVLGEFLSSEIRIETQQYALFSVISFDVDKSNNYLVTAIAYGRHYFATNIILWNLTTGQEIGTLYRGYGNGSPGEVDGLVRFSDNSDKVYFCEKKYHDNNDNFSVVIDPVQLRDFACNIAGRNLTSEEWNQYVGSNIPYEKTCLKYPQGGYPPWSNTP